MLNMSNIINVFIVYQYHITHTSEQKEKGIEMAQENFDTAPGQENELAFNNSWLHHRMKRSYITL